MKKVIVQTIVAMSNHTYYLEEEGGKVLLEFILKQCTLPDDGSETQVPNIALIKLSLLSIELSD